MLFMNVYANHGKSGGGGKAKGKPRTPSTAGSSPRRAQPGARNRASDFTEVAGTTGTAPNGVNRLRSGQRGRPRNTTSSPSVRL